jgi:Taurine catabolism dioxygenase TauD, TfdA family
MLSTEDFFLALAKDYKTLTFSRYEVDFKPTLFLKLVEKSQQFFVQNSATGLAPLVRHEGDYIDNPLKRSSWEFHMDGYAYTPIPYLVLLYCINPGRGDVQTCLYDSVEALESLSSETLFLLNELDYNFFSPEGKVFKRDLINIHPLSRKYYCHSANQGYITPKVKNNDFMQTLLPCDSSRVCSEMYDAINQKLCYKHTYTKNSLLVFDNYRYIHGRLNQTPDPERQLIRIWITPKDFLVS